jgi:hypothetical protein
MGSGLVGSAGMALAMLAAFSVAKASNGRISFSGAVLEPTCPVAEQQLVVEIPGKAGSVPRRLICGQTATDPGRSYSRVVVDLDAASVADDRLLAYFARNQNGPVAAKLIVRTYE